MSQSQHWVKFYLASHLEMSRDRTALLSLPKIVSAAKRCTCFSWVFESARSENDQTLLKLRLIPGCDQEDNQFCRRAKCSSAAPRAQTSPPLSRAWKYSDHQGKPPCLFWPATPETLTSTLPYDRLRVYCAGGFGGASCSQFSGCLYHHWPDGHWSPP